MKLTQSLEVIQTFKKIRFFKLMLRFVLLFSVAIMGKISAEEKVELSELSMKNAAVFNSQLVTGGQPSLDDLAKLKNIGVKNVINLRTSGEFDEFDEAKVVNELGINYVSLEVSGATGITFENANKLDKILGELQGKTLVHCSSSNRVGALIALRAAIEQQKTLKESIEEGEKAGLKSLKEKVIKIIGESE